MKKPILILSTVVATLAASTVTSHAQAPFSDVPTDHWAYAAVEKLRLAGIVVGYPDKTYGGARPVTRYEFSTAVARLEDKLDTLSADTKTVATKRDIDALRAEINGKLATKDDAADVRSSIDAFRAQMAQTRLNIDDLEDRVNGIDPANKPQPTTKERSSKSKKSEPKKTASLKQAQPKMP